MAHAPEPSRSLRRQAPHRPTLARSHLRLRADLPASSFGFAGACRSDRPSPPFLTECGGPLLVRLCWPSYPRFASHRSIMAEDGQGVDYKSHTGLQTVFTAPGTNTNRRLVLQSLPARNLRQHHRYVLAASLPRARCRHDSSSFLYPCARRPISGIVQGGRAFKFKILHSPLLMNKIVCQGLRTARVAPSARSPLRQVCSPIRRRNPCC